MHECAQEGPQRRPIHRNNTKDMSFLIVPLMDSGSKPCSLITAFVKQSFTLFSLNTKAQFPQCSCVPAGYKLALAAIFPVHGIAELDEVFVAADSLRE